MNRAANGPRVDRNESKDMALWMGTTPSQELSHRAAIPPTLPSDPMLKSEEAVDALATGEQEVSPDDDKDDQIADKGEEDAESGESHSGLAM